MTTEWEKAIRRGDAEAVRRLIESEPRPGGSGGASAIELIDAKDQHGQTGLMLAAMLGHTGIARVLVERGAELNVTAKYNLSALMLAVINNHGEIVRILVEAGADTAIRGTGAPGFFEKTALDLAIEAGRNEIAAILRNTPRRASPSV